jgi:hypothetical protein
MPILNWIGKDKVINHHQTVPYRVLEPQYTYGDGGGGGNMLIHGDNLDALKSLLPRCEGKIKLVYIEIMTTRLIQFNFASDRAISGGCKCPRGGANFRFAFKTDKRAA